MAIAAYLSAGGGDGGGTVGSGVKVGWAVTVGSGVKVGWAVTLVSGALDGRPWLWLASATAATTNAATRPTPAHILARDEVGLLAGGAHAGGVADAGGADTGGTDRPTGGLECGRPSLGVGPECSGFGSIGAAPESLTGAARASRAALASSMV